MVRMQALRPMRTLSKGLVLPGQEFDVYSEGQAKLLERRGRAKRVTYQTKVVVPEIKHTGGGWYELPNGEKVQGKEAAETALKELVEHGPERKDDPDPGGD